MKPRAWRVAARAPHSGSRVLRRTNAQRTLSPPASRASDAMFRSLLAVLALSPAVAHPRRLGNSVGCWDIFYVSLSGFKRILFGIFFSEGYSIP